MKKWITLMMALMMAAMLLAGCSTEIKSLKNADQIDVYVSDESGKPVAGVKIQACNDSVCMIGDTDAKGHAAFEIAPNEAEVHIMAAPAEYALDANAVYSADEKGAVNIILQSK